MFDGRPAEEALLSAIQRPNINAESEENGGEESRAQEQHRRRTPLVALEISNAEWLTAPRARRVNLFCADRMSMEKDVSVKGRGGRI